MAKRRATFAARQAKKPADQRLMNRNDFDVFVLKKVNEMTERTYEATLQWFIGFATDENP